MATKTPKVKKTAPKKPDADLFNQPKAPEAKKASPIAKPKSTIKGQTVTRNLPAVRTNTLPAVKSRNLPAKIAKPAYKGSYPKIEGKPVAKSLASKLGSAAGKLKGKGKIGLIGGLLAAGAAAGYSAYNRGTGTTKKKAAAEDSSSKDAAPVSILKGVNRRDEIGKPLTSMVTKSSAASAPKPAASTPKPAASTSPKVGGGPSKSSAGKGKIKKPATFSRGKAITLSGKTEGLKSQIPVGKTAEVKNVSFSSTAPKSKVYERATKKGTRMEKRAKRKEGRMVKKEARLSGRMEKLKSKR